MTSIRKDTRTAIALALLAVIVLLVAGTAVLNAIGKEYRSNLSRHLLSSVESMARLITLTQDDSLARVRTIADEPRHLVLATLLFAQPRNMALHDQFEAWITPLYRSRGFDGYALIAPDGQRVIASSSRAFIDQAPSPSGQEALKRTEQQGAAITRPVIANRPVTTLGESEPPGIPYQLSCARLDQGTKLLGFLCLRERSGLRLYRILDAGRIGASGETYVIDSAARILSPIHSESRLAAPDKAPQESTLFRRSARIMPPGAGESDASAAGSAPLTQVAARLLEHKSLDTGLLENYEDFRGRKVVGAARWLPDTQMGIIVEEDMDEAFRSYRFAQDALVTLIALGILLLLALTYVHWRSRRVLARSEQQLAAFRDYLPAGLHMKSANGRYLMANPVFEAVFNLPPGSVIGKTEYELFPHEEAQAREQAHNEVVSTGRPIRCNRTRRSADGSEETYDLIRFPVLGDNGGAVIAVGAVGLDITEQIRAHRELEELTRTLEQKVIERTEQLAATRDMAEAASRAKAEFLANMSHEIRTPLNAIIGMGHLAAHLNTAPRVAHYIGRIQSSSQHLLNIVNDILDLSKIEAGKLPIDVAEFSLEAIFEHVAGLVWESADAKGLELIIAIEAGLPSHLLGDSMRLGQILINFANNAVKFTDQGEVVLRVRLLERKGGQIALRFEVEDTGIGIAEDKLPLLFSPFQQLDGSMSRRFEGTGLGLAISRNLAELMGGKVSVSSHVGQGSVFSLELALRVGESVGSAIVPTIDLRNRRALAVDDNAPARGQLVALLRSLSFRVDEARGGQEAIDLIAREDAADTPFDVVFIDAKMPGLNGQETAQQLSLLSLRKRKPRLVLIAYDARAQTDQECFDAILGKPVTASELFDTVIGLFDPDRARTEVRQKGHEDWERLNGRSVLLVEDNPINQEVVHDLLEMVGVRVTVAGDGLQGIQLLNNQVFDLVLMDVHMPIMNGFEATAAIRNNPRLAGLPIVALTANALDGDRERCLAAGMNDYIAKPIDPNQLFTVLTHHLAVVAAASPVPDLPGHTSGPDASAESAGNADSAGDDAILSRLIDIPSLNVAQGISRLMGRRDLYIKLARRVAAEYESVPGKLDGALRAGDRENILDIVHIAKSALGALGAEALQERCAQMLQDLAAGKLVESEVVGFSADLSSFVQRLKRSVLVGE